MDCLFCKIIAGEIPSKKVFEDDQIFAFLDIQPWSQGHTLIVPKRHAKDIHDIDESDLQQIIIVAKQLATKYNVALGADGYNLHQSNGAAAQQEVFHFHMHLIPRYADDAMKIKAENVNVQDDLDTVLSLINS